MDLPELALRDGPVRDELELLVGEVVALEDVDGLHLVLPKEVLGTVRVGKDPLDLG